MTSIASEKDKYKLPDWAGRPPKGTHLDVVKGPKLIQKLLIDEKGYYYFGRSPTDCDFVCEHASCSRVHAVLLYHKLIKRFAILDLESSHGTFVDTVRISALTPVFLNPDQCFHFGASTRRYFLREKLYTMEQDEDEGIEIETGFSQAQSDMDNQTESNTFRNRQVPTIPQTIEEARRKMRTRPRVNFTEEEEVINPEDIDPSVGRFRNMVRTAVIPVASGEKRRKSSDGDNEADDDPLFDFYSPTPMAKKMRISSSPLKSPSAKNAAAGGGAMSASARMAGTLFAGSSLGSLTLNAAPDLELYSPALPPFKVSLTANIAPKYGPMMPGQKGAQLLGIGTAATAEDQECPSKKKYAKEAWPKDMRRRSNTGL